MGEDRVWTFQQSKIFESKRIIEGIATSPTIDLENEIVSSEAVAEALPMFMNNNAPITFMHSEFIVGTCESAKMLDNGSLFVRCRIFEDNPDVDDVWRMVLAGVIRSFSITFRRVKVTPSCYIDPAHRTVPCVSEKIYLRSITLCERPCNPDAHFDIVSKSNPESGEIDMETPNLESTQVSTSEEAIETHTINGSGGVGEKSLAEMTLEELTSLVTSAVKSALEAEKACKEDEKEEVKEEVEIDEAKKSLDAIAQKLESLEAEINRINSEPVAHKSVGVIDSVGTAYMVNENGAKIDAKYMAIARSGAR
jgi:phage head maturation protease